MMAKRIDIFLKKRFKAVVRCRLSDLIAVNFNVLTFVHKVLTTYIKNVVNVYF